MTLIFRNAQKALRNLIKDVDGLPAGEALTCVYAAAPAIIKDLSAVCEPASRDVRRLQDFMTVQAEWDSADHEGVRTFARFGWRIVTNLGGERGELDELFRDVEFHRKKAKNTTRVVVQAAPAKSGGQSGPQNPKRDGGGSGGGDSDMAKRAHSLLGKLYTGKDNGCWACRYRGIKGKAMTEHVVRGCQYLDKLDWSALEKETAKN